MGRASMRGGSMKTTFNQNNFSTLAFYSNNRKTKTFKVKHENTKKVSIVRGHGRNCNNAIIAIISLFVVFVAIYLVHLFQLSDYRLFLLPQLKCNSNLRVLIIAPENDKTINHIFENLGYDIVHDINDNWDILWSTTADPFNLHMSHMTKLKPHQLVNHFPPDLSQFTSYILWGDYISRKLVEKVR